MECLGRIKFIVPGWTPNLQTSFLCTVDFVRVFLDGPRDRRQSPLNPSGRALPNFIQRWGLERNVENQEANCVGPTPIK